MDLAAIVTLKSFDILTFMKENTVNAEVLNALAESLGELVLLGFDVTTFTPAAYQRHVL